MSLAFDRTEVERQLTAAAEEVLETMFFASIEESSADGATHASTDRIGTDRIGAAVSFHGTCEGHLAVSLGRDAAQCLAASFFGDWGDGDCGDTGEFAASEQCASVMAELANMVCGSMLSRLEKKAIFCLETPEALPVGAEVGGWIEKDLVLENGLLRLAFSLTTADRVGPQ